MRVEIAIKFDNGATLLAFQKKLEPNTLGDITYSMKDWPATEEGELYLTGFEFKPYLEYRPRTSTAPDTETNSSDKDIRPFLPKKKLVLL